MSNVDPNEVAKFDALAARWWDRDGEFRPLHDINAGRLQYLRDRIDLPGCRVLDLGCGGGLLSEALAGCGATVTGIDAAPAVIGAARRHASEHGVGVEYQVTTAEQHALVHAGRYDLVVCMELIEHVPDPAALVAAAAQLARAGGQIVFSTLNRGLKSYLLAVVGAEYVLGLLPRGTHDYARFVRPHELARWLRGANCEVLDVSGLDYEPFSRRCRVSTDPSVNYLIHARRA